MVFTIFITEIVGNMAKGRISKQVVQENKARQIFPKKQHFLPPDTLTRFEIHPFALLPMRYDIPSYILMLESWFSLNEIHSEIMELHGVTQKSLRTTT